MHPLHQPLQSPDSPLQQESTRGDEPSGVSQLGVERELTADEARAFMQRAFADISVRRMNQFLIEQAETAGFEGVRRHGE